MAEDKDNSQEKTQDPTQRRLDKAREEGKVLSSKEIFVFTSLFAGILLFYMTKFFIEDFLEIILMLLIINNMVKIPKFGTFILSYKKKRIGRNPKTLEKKIISERNVILFKPSKELKKYINNNE